MSPSSYFTSKSNPWAVPISNADDNDIPRPEANYSNLSIPDHTRHLSSSIDHRRGIRNTSLREHSPSQVSGSYQASSSYDCRDRNFEGEDSHHDVDSDAADVTDLAYPFVSQEDREDDAILDDSQEDADPDVVDISDLASSFVSCRTLDDNAILDDSEDDVDLYMVDLADIASSIKHPHVGNPTWDGAPGILDKIKAWVDKQGSPHQHLESSSHLIARGFALLLWGGVFPCLSSKHQSLSQLHGCIIDEGTCLKLAHKSLGELGNSPPRQRLQPFLGLSNKHRAALDPAQVMPLDDIEHVFNDFVGRYDRVCLGKDHTGLPPQTDTSFVVFDGPLRGRYRTITEIAAQLDLLDDKPELVTVTASLVSVRGGDFTLLARDCCIRNTEDLLYSWIGLDENEFESSIRPLAHLDDSVSWHLQRGSPSFNEDISAFYSCGGFQGLLKQSSQPSFFNAAEEQGSLWRYTNGRSEFEEAYVAGKITLEDMLSYPAKDSHSWHSTICCSPAFLQKLAYAEADLSLPEEFESHTNSSFYEICSDDYKNFLSGVINRYYIGLDWTRARHTSLTPTLAPVYQALFLCLLDFLDIDNSFHRYVIGGQDASSQRVIGLGFGEMIKSSGFGFLNQVIWHSTPERPPYLRDKFRLPWPIEESKRGLYTAATSRSSWRDYMLVYLRVVGEKALKNGSDSHDRRLFDVLINQTIYFLLRSWRAHIGELLLTKYPRRDPTGVLASVKRLRNDYIQDDRICYDKTFVATMEKELQFPKNSFIFSQRRGLAGSSVPHLAEFWWEYKIPPEWTKNNFKPQKAQYAEDFALFCDQIAKLGCKDYSVRDFKRSLYTKLWQYHEVFPHPETNHKSLITIATSKKGPNQARLLMAIAHVGRTSSLMSTTEPSRVVLEYPVLYDEIGIATLVDYVIPGTRAKRRENIEKFAEVPLKRRKWK